MSHRPTAPATTVETTGVRRWQPSSGFPANTDHTIEHVIASNRNAWVQLARAAATLHGHPMKEGDGAAPDDEDTVQIIAQADCEVLLFDLN
jgi:redox-sensitive bicupin YhaK (pirin superfamily)